MIEITATARCNLTIPKTIIVWRKHHVNKNRGFSNYPHASDPAANAPAAAVAVEADPAIMVLPNPTLATRSFFYACVHVG
jgi:hypothetical protein